ncbi:MAG: NADH-quinone oxidoreductase subunit L [Candidatus Saganbacteria bacterium]|nr:NADH-quinone oxidoreductase subunit L [Candidatus Saganbacteria bacterium]
MLYAAVIIFPFLAAALVPLASVFGKRPMEIFSVISGFVIAGLTLCLIPLIRQGSGISVQWLPNIAVGMNLDALSVNIAVIAGTIGSLIVLYSVKYMEKEEGGMRYYSLTLMFIGAMIGLVLSDNFLTLYIFWEIVGLCSYALIGFFYKDPKAVRAGIKAFITTRVGDIGLLIGILLLFMYTGTFNINQTIASIGQIPPVILTIAAFCFMAGAIGKSAQVPLHVWLPDAMEAPTTISALIHAATMVNAGIYLMARTVPLFVSVPGWMMVLSWVGVITALLSASMALVEKDLKRVLAYSTISQLGFMMFAIGVGGLFASQFHLMSHAIFKALLFLSAGAIIHEVGTRNMHEMGGLFSKMRITAVCFGAGTLALMGIPIFNGFFSKDLILASAYSSGSYLPLFFAALAAVFTVIYSLRMYGLVFLGQKRTDHATDAPWQMTLPLILLAAASLVSWMLVKNFNRAMIFSGIHVEHISFKEFFAEMFASPVTLLTLAVITAGILIFYFRSTLLEKFSMILRPFLKAASNGFGFDAFYGRIISGLLDCAENVLKVFDEGFLNGLNYMTGRAFVRFSSAFALTHTGELNINLMGMAVGVAFVLLIIFWR